jgi:hypothetical protein
LTIGDWLIGDWVIGIAAKIAQIAKSTANHPITNHPISNL